MFFFHKYRSKVGELLRLALPVMLAQLGYIAVQVADTVMVGNFGGEESLPLAAVSFGTGISWLFFFLCIGLTIGLTPIVGELFVQNEKQKISDYLQTSLVLYPLIGVLCMGLQIASEPLLYYLDQPVEVVDMALPYYRLMAYGLPFVMFYGAIKQFLEGLGNTKSAMIVAVASNVINIVLNYIFIFGKCGLAPMGIYGAGLATLISRIISPILLSGYLLCAKRYREYIAEGTHKVLHWQNSLQLLKLGFPIAGQMVLEALAFIVTGVLMGKFGTEAIGANQICNTYGNCTFMLILSLGSATTICVSHAFGRRSIDEISNVVRSAITMAVVWGIGVTTLFIVLRHVMPVFITDNAEVIKLASQMLILYAAYQISDALQCILVGVLRGLQQVTSIALISFIAYVALNIPVGCLVAFVFDMGAPGLIVGYIVGLSTAAILYGVQVRKYMRYLRKIS